MSKTKREHCANECGRWVTRWPHMGSDPIYCTPCHSDRLTLGYAEAVAKRDQAHAELQEVCRELVEAEHEWYRIYDDDGVFVGMVKRAELGR